MSISMLSKLNPKTAKLETVGYGKALIGWEEVAGALVGLPVQCTWYAYAMLETRSKDDNRKPKYTQMLIDYLTGLIWEKMILDKLKPRAMSVGQMAMGIAKAVVHCALNSAGNCGRCDGKGWVIIDAKKAACKQCGGGGVAEFGNGNKYAVAFGVVKASETERKFYQHSCNVYDKFAKDILSGLKAKIYWALDYADGNARGRDDCPDRE